MPIDDNVISAHFCLAVPDLGVAIDEFSQFLGTSFLPVEEMSFLMRPRSGPELRETLQVCFSEDRSIELVETCEKGVFGPDVGPGLHHFGLIVRDVERAFADCASAGLSVEWTFSLDGAPIATFFEPRSARHTRLELVDGT